MIQITHTHTLYGGLDSGFGRNSVKIRFVFRTIVCAKYGSVDRNFCFELLEFVCYGNPTEAKLTRKHKKFKFSCIKLCESVPHWSPIGSSGVRLINYNKRNTNSDLSKIKTPINRFICRSKNITFKLTVSLNMDGNQWKFFCQDYNDSEMTCSFISLKKIDNTL